MDVHDLKFAGLSMIEASTEMSDAMTFREARSRFEKEFLSKVIEENDGNITKTAEQIGLERSYLHRKIKSFGLDFT